MWDRISWDVHSSQKCRYKWSQIAYKWLWMLNTKTILEAVIQWFNAEIWHRINQQSLVLVRTKDMQPFIPCGFFWGGNWLSTAGFVSMFHPDFSGRDFSGWPTRYGMKEWSVFHGEPVVGNQKSGIHSPVEVKVVYPMIFFSVLAPSQRVSRISSINSMIGIHSRISY